MWKDCNDEYILIPTIVEQPCVVGWANINSNGSVSDISGANITVVRTSTGQYSLTPPTGALSVQLTVLDTTARDSIEIHPIQFQGLTAWVHEGDNGGAANNFRDRAFTIMWLGKCDNIVSYTLQKS